MGDRLLSNTDRLALDMARAIPPALAAVVELLELERPVTLTTEQLVALCRRAEVRTPPHVAIQRLAERGWLLRTGVRGVWEFAPAEHAGPFSHDDGWLTLRATLQATQNLSARVTLGSALWLLDITDRAPDLPEIAVPPGVRVPVALRRSYRIVRFEPHREPREIRGLQVDQPATVLVHLAHRPTDVRSWGAILDVLAELVASTRLDDLQSELEGRPHATWVRMAYLLSGVAPNVVAELGVKPGHKVWFGPRGKLRWHDSTWNVADTVLPTRPADLARGSQ